MCVAGMGNGSVGWLKVLTHLTLMPLTVMKRELCVCVCLGSVTVHQVSGAYPASCLLQKTNAIKCVHAWFRGKRLGAVMKRLSLWHHAVAVFPVKGVVSLLESNTKRKKGGKGGAGQHLPCQWFVKRTTTGQALKHKFFFVLVGTMVGNQLRNFSSLHVSRNTEHINGHCRSHSNH